MKTSDQEKMNKRKLSETTLAADIEEPAKRYELVSLKAGLRKKVRLLHVSDSHLILFDGRDDEAKIRISERRHREFEVSNVGRNLPFLLDALAYARENCDLLLHTGDLIDMFSLQNLEVAEKLLRRSNCFFAIGNHEINYYSGQMKESAEDFAFMRKNIQKHFQNDLEFASREINGLDIVALNNAERQFSRSQLKRLKLEIAKGLPIVLMFHIPLYTPEAFEYRKDFEEERATAPDFIGCPPEICGSQQNAKPSKTTLEFIDFIKSQPSIKALLAGHVHFHKNRSDVVSGDLKQYIVGGGYYGCGTIFEVE